MSVKPSNTDQNNDDVSTFNDKGLFVSPPMTIKKYAECQGVTVRSVTEQVNKGYLPTVKIGKRRLINTCSGQ